MCLIFGSFNIATRRKKEEGRRKKEEGRRKKEEGRRKKEGFNYLGDKEEGIRRKKALII
ncbi:MAG: hypothetical protein F6K17_00025 [Okeania sp. SIO3C4]|nr:hypothetical protein [Okeania sp. SIO3C4]